MGPNITLTFGLLAAVLCLGGCADRDPYLRTDVWKPTGANAANLAAMVADPHDLLKGRGTAVTDVKGPELGVEHIWTDQPVPFLGQKSSSGSAGSGSGSGSGAGNDSGSGSGSGGGSGSGSSGSGGGTPGS